MFITKLCKCIKNSLKTHYINRSTKLVSKNKAVCYVQTGVYLIERVVGGDGHSAGVHH